MVPSLLAAALCLIGVLGIRLRRMHALHDRAVARAREGFARDAHDLVGHWLLLATMRGELALRCSGADPPRELVELVDAVTSAAADLRDLTATYRRISLADEAKRATALLSDFGTSCSVTLPAEELPRELSALLGTVVREAVTNVLRHSCATSCSIELIKHEGWWRLTIENDGARPASGPGQGLGNLDGRVRELGGRITAGALGSGHFRLTADVPSTTQHGFPFRR